MQEHGGLVTEDPEQADTVLVPSQQKQIFIQQYMGTSSIYVEPHDFVDLCIRTGEYFHKPRNIQGIGGRPRKDGRKRLV